MLAVTAAPVMPAVLAVAAQAADEELPADPLLLGALVAVGAVVAILISTYALVGKVRRDRELPRIAAAHGLEYREVDAFDSTRVAFDLFRAGDGRRVEHVMWDEATGTRVFDYAYYVERRDQHGRVTRTWTTFSCALASHDGPWPELRLLRERLFDRALARIGLPDLTLESEEFNRAFIVQCRDPRFATALLDARMIEHLLTAPPKTNIEMKGRWVLVWSRRRPPDELPSLHEVARGICERIPPVVRDLYGTLPSVDPLRASGMVLPPTGRDAVRDPAWDALAWGGPAVAPGPAAWTGTWEVEQRDAARRARAVAEGRDGEPRAFDLDGNPVEPRDEDPWGDGRPRP